MEEVNREIQIKKDDFMALPIFITLTILLLHIAFYMKKPFGFLVNSIVFMLISILASQYMTLMVMEFKLFKQTQDVWLFICLLIFRQVFIPVISLIFINYFVLLESVKRKILLFIGAVTIMIFINYLMVTFSILEFRNWNMMAESIIDAAYLTIALVVAKFLHYIYLRESRRNESV